MGRRSSRLVAAVGCFALASTAASSQEVVHALTGVVRSLNPAAKTITVATDDGSDGTFQDVGRHTAMDFEKSLRSEAVTAAAFRTSGAHVVVYYYGVGSLRTVVALHDMGAGPFTKGGGTVVKYEKGQHMLSVEDASGTVTEFKIERSTVVDSDAGVTDGMKFTTESGQRVSFVYAESNGVKTVLFLAGA